jgi:PIN domain nuclease of toxin-antitoxin system
MIVLDTHTWIWLVNDDPLLTRRMRDVIDAARKGSERLGVSVISCWEIGMLVAKNRIRLSVNVDTWISDSLSLPEMELLDLTPPVAVAASRLPGDFHGDPADRILVATARAFDCPLMTAYGKILSYPHVKSIA